MSSPIPSRVFQASDHIAPTLNQYRHFYETALTWHFSAGVLHLREHVVEQGEEQRDILRYQLGHHCLAHWLNQDLRQQFHMLRIFSNQKMTGGIFAEANCQNLICGIKCLVHINAKMAKNCFQYFYVLFGTDNVMMIIFVTLFSFLVSSFKDESIWSFSRLWDAPNETGSILWFRNCY